MYNRYVTIWFPFLKTDWAIRKNPLLIGKAIVFFSNIKGKMIVTSVNSLCCKAGVIKGIVLADAKAIISGLVAIEDSPSISEEILLNIAKWLIRYSPNVAVHFEDGIVIDATGCSHLWGGEEEYVKDIAKRLEKLQYQINIGMASTIGAAWAVTRYGKNFSIIEKGKEYAALLMLPPGALRIEESVAERLYKLGLHFIHDVIKMRPRDLRRRFGEPFIIALNNALGYTSEAIQPVEIITPFQERLNCLDPIVTRTGIEIALRKILPLLCERLQKEQLGVRKLVIKIFRIDDESQEIAIGTNRPTSDDEYLFSLFQLKLDTVAPGLGIELFLLDAIITEPHIATQEKLWKSSSGMNESTVFQLLDRISNKIGEKKIFRFLPAARHWPEKSFKQAISLQEQTELDWNKSKIRPLLILRKPVSIQVAAPVPDYPPMHFRYKGVLHKIVKAQGPERIEQEWWIRDGQHRDYYYVESEQGCRYWLFRLGHYDEPEKMGWFIHGFCA